MPYSHAVQNVRIELGFSKISAPGAHDSQITCAHRKFEALKLLSVPPQKSSIRINIARLRIDILYLI